MYADVAHHVELDELAIHVTLYTDGSWELSNDAYGWTYEGTGFNAGGCRDIHDDESLRAFIDIMAHSESDYVPTEVAQSLRYWTEYVCTWVDHLAEPHLNISQAC